MYKQIFAVAVALCVLVSVSSAQQSRKERAQALLKEMHTMDDDSCKTIEDHWRKYFVDLREADRLRGFVQQLTSYHQKGQLAVHLGDAEGTVRECFRKRVIDEREMTRLMEKQLQGYDAELVKFNRDIAEALGADVSIVTPAYIPHTASNQWQAAFSDAVSRATAAAKRDVVRLVGNIAAGTAISDAIRDTAIATNTWGLEKGSWRDSLATFSLNLFTDMALDAATDPTDDIVNAMQVSLQDAESDVMDGPLGYVAQLRKIRDHHKAIQTKLLAP
jgi:hypothetical protein